MEENIKETTEKIDTRTEKEIAFDVLQEEYKTEKKAFSLRVKNGEPLTEEDKLVVWFKYLAREDVISGENRLEKELENYLFTVYANARDDFFAKKITKVESSRIRVEYIRKYFLVLKRIGKITIAPTLEEVATWYQQYLLVDIENKNNATNKEWSALTKAKQDLICDSAIDAFRLFRNNWIKNHV